MFSIWILPNLSSNYASNHVCKCWSAEHRRAEFSKARPCLELHVHVGTTAVSEVSLQANSAMTILLWYVRKKRLSSSQKKTKPKYVSKILYKQSNASLIYCFNNNLVA